MATAAVASPRTPPGPSWVQAVADDLRWRPGRLSSTLRIVLASVIAIVLMETLRMPFISLGMYFIFLISRDSPAISLRTAFFSIATVAMAIVVELGVVILSDNDPVARLLSVVVVTFIAGMLVSSTTQPPLGLNFGIIYCTVISLWETHAPADRLVKSSLYLVGTFAISLGCAVAIEYIFGDRNPAQDLQEQSLIRYVSLEALFRLYAQNAPQSQRSEAATRVSRIAAAGQTGMMALYNVIVEQDLDTGTLPIAIRPRIVMLAQLMDVAAAFGLQNSPTVDPDTRARCARIADECRRLIPGVPSISAEGRNLAPLDHHTLLDRVEGALHAILTMPIGEDGNLNRELVALPRNEVPFFIPGAIRSRESVAFALKISCCATFCYVLYHALDWPGISTTVITVLVAGLGHTGALKHKLFFRLLGSIIGGLLLAIGATVFLFPHMDSITSLVILVAVIAFIAAWIAAGPKFNYVGLQLAFSFYLVAFEGFSAPTQLAPARDRFVGILIALAVMVVVFDQLWPVRTTTTMRRNLASLIRLGASLFTTMNLSGKTGVTRRNILEDANNLRERLGATIADLRSANTYVAYEFGANRDAHMQAGDIMVRTGITTTALFWNQLAVLHEAQDADYLLNTDLREIREILATQLNAMADAVLRTGTIHSFDANALLTPAVLGNPHYAEYARNTVTRFEELQSSITLLANDRSEA